jgi:hypothetical protein
MTNQTLSDELVRKFGYAYAHDGKTNVLICFDCEKSLKELKDRLLVSSTKELCSFFIDYGEDKNNGFKGKPKNG